MSLFVDIDECTTSTHGCQQMCNNTQGNFTCSCHTGYMLDNNGNSCNGMPEYDIFTNTVYVEIEKSFKRSSFFQYFWHYINAIKWLLPLLLQTSTSVRQQFTDVRIFAETRRAVTRVHVARDTDWKATDNLAAEKCFDTYLNKWI
jgi:hypothetical protein